MLTVDTPIPTKARRYIRYLIKREPGFREWHMGLWDSRDVTNRMLLGYALTSRLLTTKVTAAIRMYGGTA